MMNTDKLRDRKLFKNNDKIETLTEYLFNLKTSGLNSTCPLTPEIEDLIRTHLSDFSLDEAQLTLDKFVYPGIKILSENPDALIGDAISLVISLTPFKNILFTNENAVEHFKELFFFEEWVKLSQRAICIRISILTTLIECRKLFNRMIPYLQNFIFSLNVFKEKSYFVCKSVSNLISKMINMETLNLMIYEHFFNFQNNLYNSIQNAPNNIFSEMQMYKLIINKKNTRDLLFRARNIIKHNTPLNNSDGKIVHNDVILENGLLYSFLKKLLPQILKNNDKFISNIGLEILDIILSDNETFDSNLINSLISKNRRRVINFIKLFSSNTVNNGEVIESFILELNITEIIIGTNKFYNPILSDLIFRLLKFIRLLVLSHDNCIFCKEFAESGVLFKTLLRVTSHFKQFFTFTYDYTGNKPHNIKPSSYCGFNNRKINILNNECFLNIKAVIGKLTDLRRTFQISEPEILNYILIMLKTTLDNIFLYSTSYEYLLLFTEELIDIYNEKNLTTWQLYFIVKCLTEIFSISNTLWTSDRIYMKIAAIINDSIFDRNIDDKKRNVSIKNYSIKDPNIVLSCSELLGKLTSITDQSKDVFKVFIIMSRNFIKECLKYEPLKSFNAKSEVFHDQCEFIIHFMPLFNNLRSTDTTVFDSSILDDIRNYSKNGLSPSQLNAIFALIEITLLHSSDLNMELIEDLVKKLLNYYIPYEDNNSYISLFNTYSYLCSSMGRIVNLPSPSQLNDDSVSRFNDFDTSHLLNDSKYIKDIVSRFSECTIDCVGD